MEYLQGNFCSPKRDARKTCPLCAPANCQLWTGFPVFLPSSCDDDRIKPEFKTYMARPVQKTIITKRIQNSHHNTITMLCFWIPCYER
jgi:hypothetical protein